MILGVLECLGVQLLLGFVVLAAMLEPKVCSGYWLRPEGTCATVCLCPTGPSYFQCWGRCCVVLTSYPVILGVSEYLRGMLPLRVVRVGEVSAP